MIMKMMIVTKKTAKKQNVKSEVTVKECRRNDAKTSFEENHKEAHV